MSSPTTKKVHVALNTLLDTRLGGMILLDEKFALEVTKHEDYFKRTIDEFSAPGFGALPVDKLEQIIEKRASDVIKRAMVTRMPEFLMEMLLQFEKIAINSPFITDVSVQINTYPFKIDEFGMLAITKIMRTYIKVDCEFETVYLPYEELTVDKVEKEYTALIMYDYYKWMDLHATELQSRRLRNVGLYVPALYFKRRPTEEEIHQFHRNGMTMFEFMKTALDPMINVQFVDISMFCARLPVPVKKEGVVAVQA